MKSNSAKLSLAAIAALGGLTGFVHDLHAAVVINEVYGGGGSSATTGSYNTDYVELFNNGTDAVDLTGLVIKYGSATGAFPTAVSGTSNITTLPAFSLSSGGYYLVAGFSSSSYGGPALPTADFQGNFSAAAAAGKLGLYATDGTTALDIVAYGSSATGGEGSPAGTLTTTLSAYRTVAGVDTNNNSADFTVGAPNPQNNASGVPEPTSIGLASIGSALLLRRRR